MCRITLTVGDITVKLDRANCDGACVKDAKKLLHVAGSVAVALEPLTVEIEAPANGSLGFTAHMELDPARNYEPDTSEWFEESP